jgi:hypothetical protein
MQLQIMEELLRLEADAKHVLGAADHSYEQTLLDELITILEEVELLFGPRDRSYELLPPRITECGCAYPYIYPSKKIRVYLTAGAKNRSVASNLLSHEAIHLLGPTKSWATVLEEGLAEWFCHRYMSHTFGIQIEAPNRWYDAARRAVAPLLAKNEHVIKELRERQPQLSKIDEPLLIEVAGVDPAHAKVLCADFESSWLTAQNWSEYATGGAQIFANGLRSIWQGWKA